MRLLTEDPQEIWDVTVNYFKTARSQCTTDNGWGCAYENTSGQRCVVGNLLVAETDDDERALRTYSGGWESFFENRDVPKPGHQVADMLTTFQIIHDSKSYWKDNGLGPATLDVFTRLNIAADVWGFDRVS